MIESMQVPVQMYTDALTQPIIAPVQETLTAKQAYGAGAYFIYRSKLYTTTAAISQGSPIVLEGSGANATDGGTVADFMEKKDFYSGITLCPAIPKSSTVEVEIPKYANNIVVTVQGWLQPTDVSWNIRSSTANSHVVRVRNNTSIDWSAEAAGLSWIQTN